MILFISNLSFQAMEQDLRSLFSTYGKVLSVEVVTDNFTRRSRGFGFVEMTQSEEALKAIEALHNTAFMQKTLTVREANGAQKN